MHGGASPGDDATPTEPRVLTADLCVVGGGSGGFGAACAAARAGLRVVLLEAGPGLGGTSTWAGVNNWEPVAGGTGLGAELYAAMRRRPGAVCLQQRRCAYRPERPWGWYDRDLERTDYRLSLSRNRGVPITFEPRALDAAMGQLLARAGDGTRGGCHLRLRTRFVGTVLDRPGRRLAAVLALGPGEAPLRVEATVFVDATADIHLARQCGCAHAIGPEGPQAYGEPSARAEGGLVLNNASPCYRVAPLPPGAPPAIEPPASTCDLAEDDIALVTSIRTYPNGDLNMNPLQLMTGRQAHELGPERAQRVACARARSHWRALQRRHPDPFAGYRRVWMSPALGVRETYRLVGRYVLREQDLDAGLGEQNHHDLVAIADHAIDFHGARPSREVANGPYGIPYRCLLPREVDNLLVACRGASFSALAASSCRLSRTMIVLGQAAGTAAALFGERVDRGDPEALRRQLTADGAAPTLEQGWLDAMTDVDPGADDERPLGERPGVERNRTGGQTPVADLHAR